MRLMTQDTSCPEPSRWPEFLAGELPDAEAAALGSYNEAIRLDPNNARAYFGRGNVWIEKKQFDPAVADFSEAIRLDPNDPATYFNRGNAWREKKDYEQAIADFSEAIRLDPRN